MSSMQHLFMTRHGQSLDNANNVISGSRDSMLTEVGKHQAVMAGRTAKPLKIDLIVCSPLVRSRMTAEIIAEVIGYPPENIKVLPELTERGFGVLEGLSHDISGTHPQMDATVSVESLDHLLGRAQQVLRVLASDTSHKRVLIVGHHWIGNMLKVVLAGLPSAAIYDLPMLQNAHVEEIA